MWIAILPLVADHRSSRGHQGGIQGGIAIACKVFIVGFAVGLGAVSWVIVSEIVPARIRAKCNGLFVSTNWFINILISVFTLTAIEKLGGGGSDDQKKRGVAILYGIFALITALGLALVYSIVKETGSSQQQHSRFPRQRILCWTNGKGDDNGEVIDLLDNRHRRQSSDGEPLEF